MNTLFELPKQLFSKLSFICAQFVHNNVILLFFFCFKVQITWKSIHHGQLFHGNSHRFQHSINKKCIAKIIKEQGKFNLPRVASNMINFEYKQGHDLKTDLVLKKISCISGQIKTGSFDSKLVFQQGTINWSLIKITYQNYSFKTQILS